MKLGKPYYNVELGANPDHLPSGPDRAAWERLPFAERKPVISAWREKNKAFQAWARATPFKRDYATESQAKKAIATAQKQFPDCVFKVSECTPLFF